jgi:uncharacterized protein (TIGR02145 family)
MAENLRTSTYRDGSPIQEVTWDLQWESLIRGAWSYQENYTPYDSLLGKLYNWYAVTDPRGLCPEGWHVPSDDEWIKLSDFLGENSGYKMKSSAFWNDNNNGSDESGFNGLPGGGRRSDGSFFGLGNLGYYWSSTWDNRRNAWFRYLGERTATLERKSNDVRLGLSVRCVKD